MGFIKKKLFLIGCILIFLVGVGIFVYGMGISGANEEKFAKIESQYSQVQGLNRVMVVDNVRSQYERNASVAMNDAKVIMTLARETTLRPLISNEVFPKPSGSSPDIKYQKFARSYCRVVDGYLSRMAAGQRPSLAEETKVEQEYLNRTVTNQRSRMGQSGTGSQVEKLIKDLRRQQSQEIAVYAGPQVFCGYDYWEDHDAAGDRETLLLDTWFIQLAHWIQEDVVLTIQQINGDSKSVATSPIKRLIEISFGGPDAGSGSGSSSQRKRSSSKRVSQDQVVSRRVSNSEDQLPEYVIKDQSGRDEASGALGEMTTSWTQRVSNDLVDVLHFEMAVIIDSREVTDFIIVLQSEKTSTVDPSDGSVRDQNKRNQITVLQIQHEPVDVDGEQEAGYYYGQASLTTLRLICEYIFFREGYAKLMPKPVKELFEQEEQASSSKPRSKKKKKRSSRKK